MKQDSHGDVFLPIKYDQDKFIVRLQGQITGEKIFKLCEEIDLAIDYYQYRLIQVELDSEGGSTTYLLYYFNKLKQWNESGIIVSTFALTRAISASGYILFRGNIGHRLAYSSSALLFHYGGFKIDNSKFFTQKELNKQVQRMDEIDTKFIEGMVNGIVSTIQTTSHTEYPVKELYMGESVEEDDFNLELEQVGLRQEKLPKKDLKKLLLIIEKQVLKLHDHSAEITPWLARSMLIIDDVIEGEL